MKKPVFALLVFLFLIFLIPVASAQIIEYGTCGVEDDNLSWTLDDAGELIIRGIGEMIDYKYTNNEISISPPPWYVQRELIQTIVIENGVTNIGNWSFQDCTNLINVIIAKSVCSIGKGSFYNCSSLSHITIPDTVVNIGEDAFSDCISLLSIEIPNGITRIRSDTFNNCSALLNITLPNTLSSIELRAFCFCSSLNSISFPDSLSQIGLIAFEGCTNLTEFIVGEGNTVYKSIDGVLFNKDMTELIYYPAGKQDQSYKIPKGITTVGYEAFFQCENIVNVIIPEGVINIEYGAFYGCVSLTSISIPGSIINIDTNAFYQCVNLTNIIIADDIKTKEFIRSYSWHLLSITLPENLEYLGEYAFGGTNVGESIDVDFILPWDISTVEDEGFIGIPAQCIQIDKKMKTIGSKAFGKCKKLQYIIFRSRGIQLAEDVFDGCNTLLIVGSEFDLTLKDYAETHGFDFLANEEFGNG